MKRSSDHIRGAADKMTHLLEELLELFAATGAEGLELETAIPEGCTLLADPTQLRQILWNLLRNAATGAVFR